MCSYKWKNFHRDWGCLVSLSKGLGHLLETGQSQGLESHVTSGAQWLSTFSLLWLHAVSYKGLFNGRFTLYPHVFFNAFHHKRFLLCSVMGKCYKLESHCLSWLGTNILAAGFWRRLLLNKYSWATFRWLWQNCYWWKNPWIWSNQKVKLREAVLAGCRIGKGDLGQLPWALGQSRSSD